MFKMQRKLGDDEDKHKACETVIRFKWKNIDFYGKWNEMYLTMPNNNISCSNTIDGRQWRNQGGLWVHPL